MEGVPHELAVVVGAGLSDTIPRETMMGYWDSHVQGLPSEQLDTVTDFINAQRSWLNEMSTIVDAERSRRNPPDGRRFDVV